MTDRAIIDFLGRLTGHGPNVARVFTAHNESQARATALADRLNGRLNGERHSEALSEQPHTDKRTVTFHETTGRQTGTKALPGGPQANADALCKRLMAGAKAMEEPNRGAFPLPEVPLDDSRHTHYLPGGAGRRPARSAEAPPVKPNKPADQSYHS